jgi:hypothetical protein
MANTAGAPAKSILPAAWKVPAEIAGRLGDTAGRQRAMLAEGHLLLVLHEPPGPEDTMRIGRFFWRDPEGSWKSSSLGQGIQSLRAHITEFIERIEVLDDDFQSAKSAEDYFRILQKVTPLHRTARNLHAALQEAREIVPHDHDLINLRDQAGIAERAAELVHADAKNGLDFTIARAAEEESRRSYQMAISAHRLNLLAAIFLPLATLSAVLGMNIRHGWENADPSVFWITVGIGVVAGTALMVLVAHRPAPPMDTTRRHRKR